MPGIHHSAAYSFMNGDTGRFVTSEKDIYTALSKGVRYFDSRPAIKYDQVVEYHGNSYGASTIPFFVNLMTFSVATTLLLTLVKIHLFRAWVMTNI
jgi:hypothetical protein